jgi:6-pyruvoyltetrahydropterin/6-carboxytetrahydropterin synthase
MSNERIITDSALKYIDGKGNFLRSRTELSIAKLLQFLAIEYEYNSNMKLNDGSIDHVDFKTKNGSIEVIDNENDALKLKHMFRNNVERIIAIGNSKYAGRASEIDSLFCYNDATTDLGSIFIEDPTLNFDYAHILPTVEKCSVLHGHTSSVMFEIIGSKRNGMVIDFTDAKKVIKEALDVIDHKFFINAKYLVEHNDGENYHVSFTGPNGMFDIKVPKNTAYVLNDEATIENLASELVKIVAPKMPKNIQALGAYVYEGASKGAHIISKINDSLEDDGFR